ncbi:MAG TPA: hypothetical protein DCQ64_16030 [Candidatus Rokubacteria bacterium]|nr:hypothetical protein [Candidatus Rokubacteria bacterium]
MTPEESGADEAEEKAYQRMERLVELTAAVLRGVCATSAPSHMLTRDVGVFAALAAKTALAELERAP